MSVLRKGVCRFCGANRWEGEQHGRQCPQFDTADLYGRSRLAFANLRSLLPRQRTKRWTGFKGRHR
jgi:hypothetical protein